MAFNRATPETVIRSDEYNQNLDKTVGTDEARVITVRHTFNPQQAGAPFTLGANAQGHVVSGLNADMVDGKHAADFPDVRAFVATWGL